MKRFVVLGAVAAMGAVSIPSEGQTVSTTTVTITAGSTVVTAGGVQVAAARSKPGTVWGSAQINVSTVLKTTAIAVSLDGTAVSGGTATFAMDMASGTPNGASASATLHRTGSSSDDWKAWAESTAANPTSATSKAVGIRLMLNTVQLRSYTLQGCFPTKYELNISADTTNDETLTLLCSSPSTLTVVGGSLVTLLNKPSVQSIAVTAGARATTYTGTGALNSIRYDGTSETYGFSMR
jgi:hypothetical protein